MDSNESYSEYAEGGGWKKWLIIGGIVVVVIGLGVGTFLFLRSRSGVPPGVEAPVNEAAASGEQPPSALRFQTSTDKATTVPVSTPADANGQPLLNVPQEMNPLQKHVLGAPEDSQVSLTITKPAGGEGMVAEIAVTTPAPASAAPAGGTNAAAPPGPAAPGTKVNVPVALPTDQSGKVLVNTPKPLSASEKQALGLPPSAEATVTVKPAPGGQGLVTEIYVGPVAQPTGSAGGPPMTYMGVELNVVQEMTAEQKRELNIPVDKVVKYKYVAPDASSGMVAPIMLLLDDSVLPPAPTPPPAPPK